ncbi:alpha/beta-hydrolase [Gymnopus androsaceus JB14]|uniref:Alpha/beta-hydrolase n=1 Tax=Gymnopus androsaceus JB14 TaxID=1447944 RepID=A0A6A4HW27_9AGAR|nr:alpha/beta-hydrolase [Gymnopus androsaceus JB14]
MLSSWMMAQAILIALSLLSASPVRGDILLSPNLPKAGGLEDLLHPQITFNLPPPPQALPSGKPDVRASPNTVTRIEITSNITKKSLPCGLPEDEFESGYAHLTNAAGEEDKHLFWWLFKARHDPDNAPIVMTLGGGPGASGMLFPFSGAGPCSISVDENGRGIPITSPYSWTEHVNVLSIDHPVGVGFSYGERASLRNTSLTAAWDTDDFLQVFWRQYPHLVNNEFMISSGSYGGHLCVAFRVFDPGSTLN